MEIISMVTGGEECVGKVDFGKTSPAFFTKRKKLSGGVNL